jgi:hypothetical protein
MSISPTIPGIESLTLTITQEIHVNASLQTTFEAVAVAIAQIAEPSPAGPGFNLHWHLALLTLILGANLLEQRGERRDRDQISSQSLRSDSGRAPPRRHAGMDQRQSADQGAG